MNKDKFRISEIPSASMPVVKVAPEQRLQEATSTMMMCDYSQLPVMTTEREVKGVITWKTIGISKQLNGSKEFVRDCMDSNYTVVSIRENLLRAVKIILEEEFVLVKEENSRICGICTLADIGERFLALARPFIEIEQIEDAIRDLLTDKADLDYFSNPNRDTIPRRPISNICDLTFGDYVCWFEDKTNWISLGIELDRKVFVSELRKVNQIRNNLMHFRHDEISQNDLLTLHKINKFLRIYRKNQ